MMSANSSLTKKRYNKVVAKQRLWVTAITLLTFLFTNVAMPALALATVRNDWMNGSQIRTLQEALQNMANRLMPKYAMVIWVFAAMIAVLLAFQGFAWMDNKRQVDFYESQPVSRARHYWSVVGSSFGIFSGCYIGTMALAALVTVVMGAYSNALMIEGIKVTVRLVVLFAGFYSIAVLAMVLTGNVIVAGMATAVFLFYEIAARGLIELLERAYYKTYVGGEIIRGTAYTSPASWYFAGKQWKGVLGGLILAVIVMTVAYLVYKRRKSEDAGEAVLHKPVRILAKLAVTLIAGLFSVAFCVDSSLSLVAAVAFGACGALVVGCIMEAIYNMDVRKVFRNFGWTALGAVAGCAVFCGIYFDVTGYDRWLPDASKVKDAYITCYNYTGMIFDENGETIGDTDFVKKYMSLTDIEAVTALLKAGEEYARDTERDVQGEEGTVPLQIYFRMKNGRTVGRAVSVPKRSAAAQLNAVVGTDEFKNGFLQIYHDEFISAHLDEMEIYVYASENSSKRVQASDWYEKIREAYLKDLKSYDWNYQLTHPVVYNILVQAKRFDKVDGKDFYGAYFAVYEGFDNTIEVLKEAGIAVKTGRSDDIPGFFGYY